MIRRAVIVGTGGHARVVLSLLRSAERYELLHIVELGQPRAGELIMGHPVSATPDILPSLVGQFDIDVFLAIGDNVIRHRWWENIGRMGLSLPNLVSPRAFIDPSASLGEANIVCADAFIGPEARLGSNNLINTRATVEHETIIGHHCHLAPCSTVAGRSSVSNFCLLGAGSIIRDNIFIAEHTVLGAGAVLVKCIEVERQTLAGIPARSIGGG
jgi:UDP-perosamine 4-acetyltransferase